MPLIHSHLPFSGLLATQSGTAAAQPWCELLCWCHLVCGSVVMYMTAWDAELVGNMQMGGGLSMTAWLVAGGPAVPPPLPRCPLEELQLWHVGVQPGSTAALALRGMCNGVARQVGGSGKAWSEHDSRAGSRGSRCAAAAAMTPPQKLLLCHAGV